MPKVAAATISTVQVTAAPADDKLITQAELLNLGSLLAHFEVVQTAYKDLEKRIDKMSVAILTKATGLKSEDAWKQLSPEELQALIIGRFEKKDYAIEQGKADFVVQPGRTQTCPAWAKVYRAELGDAKANAVIANTPATTSYHLAVEGAADVPKAVVVELSTTAKPTVTDLTSYIKQHKA